MRKRIMAGILSMCLLISLFPSSAFADEAIVVEETPTVTCEGNAEAEDCQAETHIEGCIKYVAPVVEEQEEEIIEETTEETVECTASVECEAEEHKAECYWFGFDPSIPCSKTEGCEMPEKHLGECSVAVAYIADPVAKIGDTPFETLDAAFTEAKSGDEVKILAAGTYALSVSGKDITITGAVDGVVFDNIGAKNMGSANVTFNNVTFDYYPNVNYTGLQHSGNLVYNDCTINGQVFLYGASETFNNCTFNQNSADAYNVWTYGAKDVDFNGCVFNSAGKSVLIYKESDNKDFVANVDVVNTKFNASSAVSGKAAIEMDSSLIGGINLTVDSNTTATGFDAGNVSGNSLWNNKKGSEGANNDITVVVGGETALKPKVTSLSGKGTEAEPYLINTVEDLVFFRDSVNAGETTYNATGVYVALNNDIDMSGLDWSVNIGDDCNATFDGIFDGKGHTIKNLNSTETAAKADGYICTGLFGAIYGNAVVKNLTIENVTINTGDYTGNNVAAVVGFAYSGKGSVENVKVIGDININAKNATGVGAIVGYDYYGKLTVKNCEVKGNNGSAITGAAYVGGIIGYASTNMTADSNTVQDLTINATSCCVGGVAGIALEGAKAVNNTVKNTALTVTHENWQNSAAVAVGTITKTVTVSGTTFSNVTVNGAETTAMVGSEHAEKPTTPVDKVVAKIGDVYYATLESALAAANGGTVTIVSDIKLAKDLTVTGTLEIPAGTTVTLDLNGKVLSKSVTNQITASNQLILNKGNLTIKDSGENGKISYNFAGTADKAWAYAVVAISNQQGTLTVDGGTIESLSTATNVYKFTIDSLTNGNGGDAKLVINGGKFTAAKGGPVRGFANSATNTNIIEINDGEFVGQVWMQDPNANANKGLLKITGGTFTPNAVGVDAVYLYGLGDSSNFNVEITDGTFNGTVYLTQVDTTKPFTADITGGTFNDSVWSCTWVDDTATDIPVITGGTFLKDPSDIVKKGYVATETDGKFGIEKADALAVSSEAELKAVLAGTATTIKLDKNFTVSEGIIIPADKTVTLDLNGKTISGTSSEAKAFSVIENKGTLTITDSSEKADGKVTYVYTGAANPAYSYQVATINNSGKLTVEKGTVENTTAAMSLASYAINTGAGATLEVKGGKVLNLNGHAIRMTHFGGGANNVTISGGYIEGTRGIQYQLPGGVNSTTKPEMSLTITGGEIKSNESTYNLAVYVYSNGQSAENASVKVEGGIINGNVALNGASTNTMKKGSASVTGGTINGQYGIFSYADDEAVATSVISITGGTFATNESECYAEDDGYEFKADGDKYIVGKHEVKAVAEKAATCTATGTKAHYKCDFCGTLYSDAEGKNVVKAEDLVIKAKGHSFGGWYTTKAATCTSAGVETRTCACGAAESKAISAKVHSYGTNWIFNEAEHWNSCSCSAKTNVTAHTYNAAGNCTACGYYNASKVVTGTTVIPTPTPSTTPSTEIEETPVETITPTTADTSIVEEIANEEVVEAVKETVTVTEGSATVDTTAIEAVIEATEDGKAVIIPLVQAIENVVNEASISADALITVAEIEKDVVIELTDVTVKLDAEAVKAVVEQAAGKTVEIRAVKTETAALTEAQKSGLADKETAIIVTAQIFSDGQYIGDFKGGKATISLPFEPEEGKSAEDYAVYYVDENGELHEVAAEYVNGHMVFTTAHFSDYAIVYEGAPLINDEPVVTPEPTSSFPIVPIIIAAAVILVGGIIFIIIKKKAE